MVCVGNYAFSGCEALTAIEVPDNVIVLGNYAFEKCSGAKTATIGTGVTAIDDSSFFYCTALTDVTIRATTPPMMLNDGEAAYYNFYISGDTLHVPAGCVDAYEASEEWAKVFTDIVAISQE